MEQEPWSEVSAGFFTLLIDRPPCDELSSAFSCVTEKRVFPNTWQLQLDEICYSKFVYRTLVLQQTRVAIPAYVRLGPPVLLFTLNYGTESFLKRQKRCKKAALNQIYWLTSEQI